MGPRATLPIMWAMPSPSNEGEPMKSRVLESTTAQQIELPQLDARDIEIYCWRVEQLERAGYSGAFAHMLAENCEIDLHLACDLLSRGCTEQTAYSILI